MRKRTSLLPQSAFTQKRWVPPGSLSTNWVLY